MHSQWDRNCNLLCRLLTLSVEQYSQLLIQRAILQTTLQQWQAPKLPASLPDLFFFKQIHIQFQAGYLWREENLWFIWECVLNHLINHIFLSSGYGNGDTLPHSAGGSICGFDHKSWLTCDVVFQPPGKMVHTVRTVCARTFTLPWSWMNTSQCLHSPIKRGKTSANVHSYKVLGSCSLQ